MYNFFLLIFSWKFIFESPLSFLNIWKHGCNLCPYSSEKDPFFILGEGGYDVTYCLFLLSS